MAIDNDWYQTNGADGIPHRWHQMMDSTKSLGYVVPGQMWYDKANNNLLHFSGR